MRSRPDLAVLYEHPDWFRPLFAELDRRGVRYEAIRLSDHHFAIDGSPPPAPLIFSRLAMSSFLRQEEHSIFYARALFDQWERAGATIINGNPALEIDTSKARQLSLIRSLGLEIPATRVVHRRQDVPAAAEGLRWPIIVKANIGGAGAGVERYDSPDQLASAIEAGTVPIGIDSVALVQEYIPAEGRVVRVETLNGRFLYAIALDGNGDTFDLCPADACMIGRPPISITRFEPDAETIAEAEAIARAARLDIGGIEYLLDSRDGARRWYDINALSNFVADPLNVLGHDPHEILVEELISRIAAGNDATVTVSDKTTVAGAPVRNITVEAGV
jgi:hypothetical protein